MPAIASATIKATTLTGTLSTAAQPNVTSVGTLTSLNLGGALTYGGVTLSNAVTGTGNMVLSASPTFTGTITASAISMASAAALSLGGSTFAKGSGTTNALYTATASGLVVNNQGDTLTLLTLTNAGALTLHQAGMTITTGGLTVSAGTTAVQALTATSGIIDQGGGDGEILTLRSSDVGHGFTSLTAASSYGTAKKQSATAGGLRLDGYSLGASNLSFVIAGNSDGAASTTKSTAATAPVVLTATERSGTSSTDVGANGNLIAIYNNSTCRFIFDAEGDGHADSSWVTF